MKSRLPVVGGCLLTTLLVGIWLGQSLPLKHDVNEEIVNRSTVSPFNSDGWQLASGQQFGPSATLKTDVPFGRSLFPNQAVPSPFRSEPVASDAQPVGPDVAYFPEAITGVAGGTDHHSSVPVRKAHSEESSHAMATLSKEGAAVWRTELKNLPPEQAEEILNLRRQLGSVASESLGLSFPEMPSVEDVDSPGLFPELAAGDARPIPIAGAFPEDAPVVQASAAKESPLAKQLREAAERVYAENDANHRTIGFKRTQIVLLNVSISTVNAAAISTDVLTSAEAIPTVGDETASEQSQSSAVYWLTRLDLRPGGMKQTGNPLDLMINGPGWLQVERNGQYEFVRSGMLGFRDDGRLGIHTGVGLLPIVPAIQFPIERQRIVIAESGEIYSETADGHEKLDSQLVSVNFRDASALKRTAAGTYTVTNDSGPALDTRPGFVTFLQAVLEESNVDIGTELADVMRLKAIAGQLAVQP